MSYSRLRLPGQTALKVPIGLFINNVFRTGRGTPMCVHLPPVTKLILNEDVIHSTLSVTINPATGSPLLEAGVQVQGASKEDVDDAVIAARTAFRTTWGQNATGPERSRLINKLADVSSSPSFQRTIDCEKSCL